MKQLGWMLAGAFQCATLAHGAEPIMVTALPARAGLVEAERVIAHPGDLTAGAGTNQLGWQVAISGDTALVGAPFDDTIGGNLAGSVLVFTRTASGWGQQARLVAQDTVGSDYFGASVAIQGDTAIVGAPGHDQAGLSDAGAVYVFRRVGDAWEQRAKLTPADAAASAEFGESVSLDAATLVVGATGAAGRIGAVYSFVGADATWLQEARMVPPSGRAGDDFGGAVALYGDSVVVGAVGRMADPDIRRAGSVFVFLRTAGTWTQQSELRAPNPTRDDFFGNSVALHVDTVLVGASSYGPSSGGAAFVFRRSGSAWSVPTRLIRPNATDSGYFGSSVALTGTRAVVGARSDSRAGFLSGAAFVFADSGTGWGLLDTLTASDAEIYGDFGAAVALDGNTAVIGAPLTERVSGSNAGAAYFFTESGSDWVEVADVDGGDDASRDLFGYSMAVSGDTLVVGAPHESVGSIPDVAAHVFVRDGADWALQASLRASNGFAAAHFGASVALDGDTLAVGTPWDYGGEAVYIFVRADGVWTERARIVSPDAVAPNGSGRFGASLALDRGTLVVGAPEHYLADVPGRGAAYVFTGGGSTWTLQARLSDGSVTYGLATEVALSGDIAVLGAPECTSSNLMSDRALVFVRNGISWTLEAQLIPDRTAWCESFGSAISIYGKEVLIGAPLAQAAYLFSRSESGWSRIARIDSAGFGGIEDFGRSVSLSQDVALIGASSYDLDFPEPGAAYVLARSGSHWALRDVFRSPAGAADKFGHVVALSGPRALVGAPTARGVFSGHYKVGAVYEHEVTLPLFFAGFE